MINFIANVVCSAGPAVPRSRGSSSRQRSARKPSRGLQSFTGAGLRPGRREASGLMKLIFEILIAVFLHPVAVVLMWIDLAGRDDLQSAQKVIWAIVGLLWGIGPILYILVGDGDLW